MKVNSLKIKRKAKENIILKMEIHIIQYELIITLYQDMVNIFEIMAPHLKVILDNSEYMEKEFGKMAKILMKVNIFKIKNKDLECINELQEINMKANIIKI